MIKILLEFFAFFKRRHYDHDGIDNLNTRLICIYAFTVGFLFFASEYGAHSIQCFPKASWRSGWKQYAEDLCLVEGSYFVDPNSNLPHHSDLPNYQKVSFYQWTPFIFLLIAFIFYLPRVFWSWASSPSYLFFEELCNSSIEARDADHKKAIRRFAEVSMNNPALLPAHTGFDCLNRLFDQIIGNKYLIISYIIMKIWHIVNVVVAQFLLCLLIPNDLFGFKTVWKMHINGYEWKESGVFPRLTTCDIAIRQYSGEIGDRIKHEQTQCFLAANNYIEKVFFWTWIIFVVLFFINLYSLCNWSWKIWNSKIIVQQYIEERLEKEQSKETLAEYANLLLPDARFTILMVAAQSHEMIGAADLVTGYMEWKNIRY